MNQGLIAKGNSGHVRCFLLSRVTRRKIRRGTKHAPAGRTTKERAQHVHRGTWSPESEKWSKGKSNEAGPPLPRKSDHLCERARRTRRANTIAYPNSIKTTGVRAARRSGDDKGEVTETKIVRMLTLVISSVMGVPCWLPESM